ncbi:MAG: M23 family metallopeptidase, partial [Propionibacterium sp.]|nr:M23 family metallopeptidase [Propionibacterium sp.]
MRVLAVIALALWLAALPALPTRADDALRLEPPVQGAVLRGFEIGPTKYAPGHRGVDLRASPGGQVRAAAEG